MTHERLTELLSYDKDSGQFVWLKTNSNRAKAGCVAGTERKDGYVLIGIDGVLYTAHRLAWFYVNNYWPDGVIDHINRDRSDNRFCNLRCVSRFENAQNANVSSSNKSGTTGVSYWKKRGLWQVKICINGRHTHVGCFESLEDAIDARKRAEEKHYPAKVFADKRIENEKAAQLP